VTLPAFAAAALLLLSTDACCAAPAAAWLASYSSAVQIKKLCILMYTVSVGNWLQ